MKALQGVGAALAMAMACAALARGPAFDGYKSFAGTGYTLVARYDSDAARVALAVEKVNWLLSLMLNHDSHVQLAPTFILTVPRPVFVRYLQPGNGIIGEFVPGRFSNYLLLSAILDEYELNRALYHEYNHLFLHTRFRGAKPLWFDEGMAELIEGTRFADTYVEVGYARNPPEKWLPFDQLLRLDKSSPEYRNLATTHLVHVESWGIVHFALLDDMDFRRQVFAFLDSLDELKPIDQAVQSSFNMTVAQLDRKVHDHMESVTLKLAHIPFAAPRREKQTGSPLTELQSILRIADAMFVSGFQPQNLHEIVEAAVRIAPDAPEVRVLQMRLAARDHDDVTLNLLSHGIASETATPALARAAGLALFERVREQNAGDPMKAEERTAIREKAMDLLGRSIVDNSGDAETVWAFGLLASELRRDLTTATRRVREVRETLPYNPDLAMAEALLSESQGDTDNAIANMTAVLRLSRVPEQRVWANAQLDRLKNNEVSRKHTQ